MWAQGKVLCEVSTPHSFMLQSEVYTLSSENELLVFNTKSDDYKFDFYHGKKILVALEETGNDAENSASLYTSAESNLGDIVLGELEKSSFIALPGRGEHSRLMPSKPSVPAWGRQ